MVGLFSVPMQQSTPNVYRGNIYQYLQGETDNKPSVCSVVMGNALWNEMWKSFKEGKWQGEHRSSQLAATGLHIYKAVVFGMCAQPRGNIANEFYIHLDVVIISYPHLSLYKRLVPTICSTTTPHKSNDLNGLWICPFLGSGKRAMRCATAKVMACIHRNPFSSPQRGLSMFIGDDRQYSKIAPSKLSCKPHHRSLVVDWNQSGNRSRPPIHVGESSQKAFRWPKQATKRELRTLLHLWLLWS